MDKIASIAFNLHAFGEGTKLWWLVNSDSRDALQDVLASHKGSLHKDNFWLAPGELEATGLPMWFVEQRAGELVIVPPLVPHMVLNAVCFFRDLVAIATRLALFNVGYNRAPRHGQWQAMC